MHSDLHQDHSGYGAANEGIKWTRETRNRLACEEGGKCGKTPSETEDQAKGKDLILMSAGFLTLPCIEAAGGKQGCETACLWLMRVQNTLVKVSTAVFE